jgi:hypothetical protein
MPLACKSSVISFITRSFSVSNSCWKRSCTNSAYRHQARRSYPAGQTENRKSHATLPGSLDDTLNVESIPSRNASQRARYSQPVFNGVEVPHLVRTPWELERHKRNSVRSSRKRMTISSEMSPNIFKRLPREVYDCVVEKLEQLHLAQDDSCSSCFTKDLYSLSLTNRAWDRAATLRM